MQSVILSSAGRQNLSNCFEYAANILEELHQKNFIIVSDSAPVVLLKNCGEFFRLFYFLGSEGSAKSFDGWEDLSLKVRNISRGLPVYADITLKGNFTFEGSVFEKLCFKPFRNYIRMIKHTPPPPCVNYVKNHAGRKDLNCIQDLLHKNFNPASDHLPDANELEKLIDAKQVFMQPSDIEGEIKGVLIFENFRTRAYLRALCVEEKYRSQGVGSSLMATWLNAHRNIAKLFYLWVNQANQRVIKFYERFGFRWDGLKNIVVKLE